MIENDIKKEFEPESSDNLFPQNIFYNTRGYLISFAKEASAAYDYSLDLILKSAAAHTLPGFVLSINTWSSVLVVPFHP